MPTRLNTFIGLTAAAFFACASAIAAPGDDRFPIDLDQAQARGDVHFRALDANGNGQVDMGEFESAPGPGHLSGRRGSEGVRAHRKGHGAGRGPRERGPDRPKAASKGATHDAIQGELFALLDQDDNGQLSTEEFRAADHRTRMLARKRAQFKHLDANDDGVIERSEMPGSGQRLREADADGDGQVTRKEMRAAREKRLG